MNPTPSSTPEDQNQYIAELLSHIKFLETESELYHQQAHDKAQGIQTSLTKIEVENLMLRKELLAVYNIVQSASASDKKVEELLSLLKKG